MAMASAVAQPIWPSGPVIGNGRACVPAAELSSATGTSAVSSA